MVLEFSHHQFHSFLLITRFVIVVTLCAIVSTTEAAPSDHLLVEHYADLNVEGDVTGVAWSPDGSRIAAISDWGRQITVLTRQRVTHTERVETAGPYLGSSLTFMPDNKTLVIPAPDVGSESWNSALALWDTDTGKLEKIIQGAFPSTESQQAHAYNRADTFDLSTSGKFIVAVPSARHPATLYDTENSAVLQNIRLTFQDLGINNPYNQTPPQTPETIASLALSPHATILALGVGYGTIALINLPQLSTKPHVIKSYDDLVFIESVAFSPDSKLLATGKGPGNLGPSGVKDEKDSALKIWDLSTLKLVADDRTSTSGIRHIIWSHDGNFIATNAADHHLRIYKLPLDAKGASWDREFTSPIMGVVFSPGGRELAVASGKSVSLWRIKD